MIAISALVAAAMLAQPPINTLKPLPKPAAAEIKKELPAEPVKPPVLPDPPPVKKAAAASGCSCSCGCEATGDCTCGGAQRGAAPTVPKLPGPAATPVVSKPQIAVSLRQPSGHTHTCAAGHTWDHASNPTHTCNAIVGLTADGQPIRCGRSQIVQDQTPRMVTVTQVVAVPAAAPKLATPAPAPASAYQMPAIFSSSGGCANGNCANVSRSSVSVIRRR